MQLLPLGMQQCLDANGDPLVGGKIYFYLSGTNIPADTWSTAAGGTPNSNPVILNSAAEAVIWGTGSYRQVVHDVNDNLIWDTEVIASVSSTELAQPDGSSLVGWLQGGTGAVPRTVLQKLKDFVCVFDFMTEAQISDVKLGNRTLDVTAAVQLAVTSASRIYFPAGSYRLDSSVTGASDKLIYGDGDLSTKFDVNGGSPGFVFDGGFSAGGRGALQRIVFRDVCFNSRGGGSGIRFTGCMNVRLQNVRFLGGTDYQLQLEQVFDSEFDSVYWASTSGSNPAINIRSGTFDCSNNLRFSGCTWEQLSAGAIRSVTETGGLENYSITFSNACKWERCNISAAAAPWISMSPASGSRAHVSVAFENSIFAFDDDTTSLLFYGEVVSQISWSNIQVSAQSTRSDPLMEISQSVLFKVDGLYISIPNLSNTGYVPINNSGTNIGLSLARVMLNNSFVRQAAQVVGTTTLHSVQNIQNTTGAYQQYTLPGVLTYSFSLEGDGVLTARSSLLANNIVYQVTSAGRMAANYGLTNRDSAWNGALFRLGAFNFWVDAAGCLRIKNGVPTSDTDGTIVGTQS